jgi:hypothetical protein
MNPQEHDPDTCRVCVSRSGGSALERRAREVADACGLEFFVRGGSREARFAVVIERLGAHLVLGDRTMISHPGMGLVRVRRLEREAEGDPLVDACELQPGDRILDCTFGFGQDALVLAYAAGPAGRVHGLEASGPLAALSLAGMPSWSDPGAEIVRRITLEHADYRTKLPTIPDKSFDVVLFDPMFRRAQPAAPDFVLLRALAEHSPLDPASFEQAKRIARRTVIVKDGFSGQDLTRLGLLPQASRRRADIVFGVWRAE